MGTSVVEIPAGSGLMLRLVSAKVPYLRGGLQFHPWPERGFGLLLIDLADLADGAVDALLADPFIDVSAGGLDTGFWPIDSQDDLLRVALLLSPVADEAPVPPIAFTPAAAGGDADTALIEARLAAEQSREGGPMGDEAPPAEAEAAAETPAGAGAATGTPAVDAKSPGKGKK